MIIESGNSLEAAIDALEDASSNTPPSKVQEIAGHNSELETESSNDIKPLLQSFQKLEFESALDFLCFFDVNINEGNMTLHQWQGEVLAELSAAKGNSKHPYKYCLCAANGSGKDAFIVAPWALFFICCKIRSLVVITSASGTQLTSQTETYIKSLAAQVNAHAMAIWGQEILKVKQRHVVCTLSGSEIRLFATDEEGKAEGFHPKDFNSEMCIIVNEAKNVAPEIFRALKRCTGFSHWINVSTPGQPQGDFYESFERWPNKRRVTYYDCPHQSPEEFEEDKDKLGEHDPFFRSKWLAEFSFTGGKYVISQSRLYELRKLIAFKKVRQFGKTVRVGIDIALSTAGDETVIEIFIGNKHFQQICYRIKDATLLADAICKDLEKYGIRKDSEHIFADDCGVGRAVIDLIRKKGWNVKRVQNNSQAKNTRQFRNRGAELWHKFGRLIESAAIILLDDDKLYKQIASRKYKETEAGIDKLQLQGKQVMIAEGLKSPDRADACVLAFADANLEEFLTECIKPNEEEQVKVRKTPEEIMAEIEDQLNYPTKTRNSGKRLFGSTAALLKKSRRATILNGKWS